MLDIKRVLQAAAVNKHSDEDLRQLWTPWGERIRDQWLGAGEHAEFAEAGSTVDKTPILAEHPRPTMVRDNYTMLNGFWDFVIVPISQQTENALSRQEALQAVQNAVIPDSFNSSILVPFAPESALSGVHQQIMPNQLIWYRKHVVLADLEYTVRFVQNQNRIILHFEAVDWVCACYINGQLAGTHVGGYTPFDIDITQFVAAENFPNREDSFEIALCVYDPNEFGTQPRGKQKIHRGGIWYTAQSGIWQSVWLEVVPQTYVSDLTLNGNADGELEVYATVNTLSTALALQDVDARSLADCSLHIRITDRESTIVGEADIAIPATHWQQVANQPAESTLSQKAQSAQSAATAECAQSIHTTLRTQAHHLWSPENPYLYDVQAVLTAQATRDVIHSYCAFRTIELRADHNGAPHCTLNGKPIAMRGVLDQGYWPESLMTAPSDEALQYDILAMKQAGFTMLRKHIKIECARWYYHCDRLGMLVWQDAVCGGGKQGNYNSLLTNSLPTLLRFTWNKFRDTTAWNIKQLGSEDAAYRQEWVQTCTTMVRRLQTHPSIVVWALFNEGWGQFQARAAAEHIHNLDSTRLIDATSGWYDQHCGDFYSVHNYFRPLDVYKEGGLLQRALRALRGHFAHSKDLTRRGFALSEFGGLTAQIPDHSALKQTYGYATFDSLQQWREAVQHILNQAQTLENQGLTSFVYTQLSDVEGEMNGLLTYDRRVNKLQPEHTMEHILQAS